MSWLLLLLWYGIYAALALFLAFRLPDTPLREIARWFPSGLLAVFLFWQVIPLFTLSSGWSLQLNKLQIYPVRQSTLFGIETFLRITSAPEMIIVLVGATVGLCGHPQVPNWASLILFLFIPLNLFLQLAIRDLILHAFERNRFRELFAVVVISVGILPQLLIRTSLGATLKPYFLATAGSHLTPWSETASLSLGRFSVRDALLLLAWTAVSYFFARWMFHKGLIADDSFQQGGVVSATNQSPRQSLWSHWPARIFRDPLAALVQKEMQSLVRMPKFRVLFGMSCILGIVVFVPAALNGQDPTSSFMRSNLIPVVNVYGLLLLSDTLLLNAFGLDRGAAQTYFVMPVSLPTVLQAKNAAAIVFVLLQSAVILLVATLARAPITGMSVLSGMLASAVVTVFLLVTGNLTSLAMPRPIDPKQTFKKQAGAKMQLWLFGCSISLFALVGFAYLARYAFQREWVFLAVLGFEFLVGIIAYRLGLESAVERAIRDREAIVQMLSKSASPLSLS